MRNVGDLKGQVGDGGCSWGREGGFWRWGGNGKDPRVVVEPMGETTRECGRQWEKAWGLRGGWERPPTMGGGGGALSAGKAMGETLGGDDKHSPPRMGCGMGETLMDRGGKGGRPLGRGKGNWRSPHGPHWQWEETPGHAGGGGRDHGGEMTNTAPSK